IVGQNDCGDATLADCDAHRAIDQMPDLRRRRGLLDKGAGDVLEQAREIDLLLIMAAHGIARLLSGDGQHRHVIEPRVIEAGDEVRGARTGCGDADAELAGELGVSRRHEGGHLFVAGLGEFDLAVGALQRAEHAVDAVARVAENLAHAPRMETFNQKIADSLRHGEHLAETPTRAPADRVELVQWLNEWFARKFRALAGHKVALRTLRRHAKSPSLRRGFCQVRLAAAAEGYLLLLLFERSGTQVVVCLSYFRPGADLSSSLLAFMVRRIVLSLSVFLTASNLTATSFSPAPRKPPTLTIKALILPSESTSTSLISPILLFWGS